MKKEKKKREPLRWSPDDNYSRVVITRAKAIRLNCLACSNNQIAVIRTCEITSCPLWQYRMGRKLRDDELPDQPTK